MKNQNGFMLIQVMIAGAIMAMLGLALAGMLKDVWRESASVQVKNNETVLALALRQQVSTPELCLRNFKTTNLFTLNDQEVTIAVDGNFEAKSGATLAPWGVVVKSLEFRKIEVAMNSVDGKTLYTGNLRLTAEPASGKKLSFKTKELGKIFLLVNDADKKVVQCHATETPSEAASTICNALGGQYDTGTKTCDTSSLLQATCEGMGSSYDAGSKKCDNDGFKERMRVGVLRSLGRCKAGDALKGFSINDGSFRCEEQVQVVVNPTPTPTPSPTPPPVPTPIPGPILVKTCSYTTYVGFGCGKNQDLCCPSGTRAECDAELSEWISCKKDGAGKRQQHACKCYDR